MANEFIARKGLIVLTNGIVATGSTRINGDITASGDVVAVNFRGSGQYLTDIAANSVQWSNILNKPGLISSSLQFTSSASPFTGSFTGSFFGDGSQLSGVASSLKISGSTSGTDVVNLTTDGLVFSGSNNVTATVTNNTVTIGVTGLVSQSSQIDVRNTTGIATIATTGSNTFTGVQTISNTTNSTAFNNGALIIAGGVGIAKDVNISGSLTVTGLLTAVSSSIQYVTSSQLIVTDNKIVVNTNDLVRFGGLSVVDSGSSSPTTASIFWDSLNHHFLYENLSGSSYNSALLIAGPKNTGALGNEVGLTAGRIPVATGTDHIDTNTASSSIYIDFATKRTFIEAGLYVTGAVSSSLGFWGDGSNLTGVVSTLAVTGSQGGQGSVNLKTQGLTVTGTNGVAATVSGQTLTISGSNASTTTKGVASFNSTNFAVNGGEVTSNNITINGGTVTLGGTRNITLSQITTQGSTTTDAVTLTGGATIGNSFQTSSTYTATGPTTNEVVISLATGSYDAAHFTYTIKQNANLRTGTVMSVWSGATVEYTDTSTNDIGNTSVADFTVDTSLGNVRLKFSATSGTWIIKTAARLI